MEHEQYTSLADLLNKSGIGESQSFTDYTIEDIYSAVIAYLNDHGQRPTQRSGNVLYPPFEEKLTWNAISQSSVLNSAGYNSLHDFCEKNEIGESSRFYNYNIEDIKRAVLSFVADHNTRPKQKDGLIPYPPFNNRTQWQNIYQCKTLKEAGFNSLTDFCDTIDGCPPSRAEYTINDIENAIICYINEHGYRPTQKSSTIPYPPFNNLITWYGVDCSKVLNNAGYNSITDFCDQNDIGIPNRFSDYTIEDVERALKCFVRDNNKRPTASTAETLSYPPFDNRTTWSAVSSSKIVREAGYVSITDMCERIGIGQPNRLYCYSIENIKNAAQHYFDEHGKRPSSKSGAILYSPFDGKTTWKRATTSKAFKNSPFSSLDNLCDYFEIGPPTTCQAYTIEDIDSAARKYYFDHGKRPTVDFGKIKYSPFDGLFTWDTISSSKVMKAAGYKSLADYCNKNKIGRPKNFSKYEINDIQNAVILYIQDHGQRPQSASGLIPYPPFNNQTTWKSVNRSKILKDAGFSSLSNFINQSKLAKPTKIEYTIEHIFNAIALFTEQHEKVPSVCSGKIPYPPFNNNITWQAINASKVLKEAGYRSLSDFCKRNGFRSIRTDSMPEPLEP